MNMTQRTMICMHSLVSKTVLPNNSTMWNARSSTWYIIQIMTSRAMPKKLASLSLFRFFTRYCIITKIFLFFMLQIEKNIQKRPCHGLNFIIVWYRLLNFNFSFARLMQSHRLFPCGNIFPPIYFIHTIFFIK